MIASAAMPGLKIGYLKLIGGLLLLWIGIKLVQGEEEGEGGVKAAGSTLPGPRMCSTVSPRLTR